MTVSSRKAKDAGLELIIALDQGSSSSRALAIDPSGRVIARTQHPIKAYYPRSGWVEHDAEEIARTQERALDEILAKVPKSARILGLGLASQRTTVIFWDRKTGKPACRAPSWQDGRASGLVAPLMEYRALIHHKTGLYLTPYYSAPKIRWFLEKVPAVKRLADQGRLMVGPVSTYLVWRLTGGDVFAVDPTMAQRMLLFNLRTFDWDPTLLDFFKVPKAVLPELKPSTGVWGICERGGRRIPILACLGDQQAATFGMGATDAGSSVANYGTGAFFLMNTGHQQHRIPGIITSVGWQIGGKPANFLEEGTVHAAGTSYDWLRENFGHKVQGSNIDRLCRQSTHRVLALQAIGGLGAPRWDYTTRTAYFGLTSRTKPADLVRAVTEGIAFLISDIVERIRGAGLRPAAIKVSGGLSRVDYLMQFQSDILGLEISRCRETEVTALGIASLAAQTAGAPWAGELRSPQIDKVFKPRGMRSEALLEVWHRFVDAQVALSRDFGEL